MVAREIRRISLNTLSKAICENVKCELSEVEETLVLKMAPHSAKTMPSLLHSSYVSREEIQLRRLGYLNSASQHIMRQA